MDRNVDPNDFRDWKTTIKNMGKAILLFTIILTALYLIGK